MPQINPKNVIEGFNYSSISMYPICKWTESTKYVNESIVNWCYLYSIFYHVKFLCTPWTHQNSRSFFRISKSRLPAPRPVSPSVLPGPPRPPTARRRGRPSAASRRPSGGRRTLSGPKKNPTSELHRGGPPFTYSISIMYISISIGRLGPPFWYILMVFFGGLEVLNAPVNEFRTPNPKN